MAEIVKFNIGGQRYDVSRSLLESHQESMLAKIASEQWQKDRDGEIFIQRDGVRFRYVIGYMQDGRVTLPITESKEALLVDLEYYGIDVVDDDDCIDVSAASKIKTIPMIKEGYKNLMDLADTLKAERDKVDAEYRVTQMSAELLRLYAGHSNALESKESYDLYSPVEDAVKEIGDALKDVLADDDAKDKINVHLNTFGLHLSKYVWEKTGIPDVYLQEFRSQRIDNEEN